MSAPIIFLPVIPAHHHQEPAHEPAAAVQATASGDAVAATTRAEHDRRALLDIRAFEQAERLAEGARQAAVAAAAAKLQAFGNNKTGDDFDRHNHAVRDAEVWYLQAVIAAAEQYGVLAHGWKQTLETLPPVISSAVRAEGKAYW